MAFGELYTALENTHGRRPGKSLHRHPVQQVLRGAEIRLGHQPHLHAEHHPRQQDLLGQAVAGRAEDDARQPMPRARDYQTRADRAADATRRSANCRPRACSTTRSRPAEQARMRKSRQARGRQDSPPTYDPETVKLFNDELERIRKDVSDQASEVLAATPTRSHGRHALRDDAWPLHRPATAAMLSRSSSRACLAVMVVLVFGNVVLRYVFNSGITDFGGAVALAAGLADVPRRHRRAAPARPSRRRHAGPRAAAARQEDLLHRELLS